MSLTLTANAKLNLGLRIVGRRYDGYHLLHTLFQEVDFGDEVTLTNRPNVKVTLEVTGPAGLPVGLAGGATPRLAGTPRAGGIPTDASNLCLRAARLFKESTGTDQGVHIRLEKRIPAGAGLGGGSSDAAAVFKGLNELWARNLSADELETLAVKLGADVPFFIRGGLQLGAGIGEVLTPLKRALPYSVVLVIPPFGVDTAWAYRQFASRRSFLPPPAFDQLIAQDPIPWEAFTNDFEEVVFPRYGQLAEIKKALLEAGAVYASLSGSGSAVVGLFEELLAVSKLQKNWPDCKVVSANLTSRAS